tara:strand:- start:835 stop:1032 length:198 start_codon:yes stop_codon:yes gene_type:complete
MQTKNEDIKFIREISIIDPDYDGPVAVEVWKDLASGLLFGVDSSYLEQVSSTIFNPIDGQQYILD